LASCCIQYPLLEFLGSLCCFGNVVSNIFPKMVRTNLKQATDKQRYIVSIIFMLLLCLQILLPICLFVDANCSKNVEIIRFIVTPSVQNIVPLL